jgi:hypothetical protein
VRLAAIERRIVELESSRRGSTDPATVLALLDWLASAEIRDGNLLARFHDALLYLCAYPPSPQVLRRAESLLKRFGGRVARLEHTGDISPLLEPEVSGIAGTSIETPGFSYEVVRWLQEKFPRQTAIDWNTEPAAERLVSLLTPLIPFLGEESNADANVDYRPWLAAASLTREGRGLEWLLRNLGRIPIEPHQLAALYDSIQLTIQWRLGESPMSRTRMRRRPRSMFFQRTPPLPRRDVSLAREIAAPPLRISKLPLREGEAVLDLARASMAVRYRELYCFNWGDPRSVISADAGRGLQIFLVSVVPEKRLPLRASFGTFFLRNGVPVGYADAFGLCERIDVSFNIFYAFRDGESAYCFAQLLKLYRQLFGSTSFSIDPFQLGVGNEEAIKAGAFWFYRKLGFRSVDPAIERLAQREEERISEDPRERTPARVLRRMARSSMTWDANQSDDSRLPARSAGRDWDRFHVRNLGIAVQRNWSRHGGSSSDFIDFCLRRVAAQLQMKVGGLTTVERRALEGLAPVLMLARMEQFSEEERAAARRIVHAKAARREDDYLRLLSQHERLRRSLLDHGSVRKSKA